MSLINDILRDLDARKAAEDEIGGLDRNVRALPPKPKGRAYPVVLIAVLVLVSGFIGGGTVFWLLQRPPAVSAPIVPPASTSAPIIAPSVATPPPPPPTTASPVAPVVVTPPAASTPPAVAPATPVLKDNPAALPPAKPISTTVAPAVAKPVAVAPATPALREPAKAPSALSPTSSMPASAEASLSSQATQPGNTTSRISKEPALSGTVAEQADVEYRRGITAVQRGDSDAASTAFRAALRLVPAHVGARQALLGLWTEQQRWSDVETLALDGVGLLPQRSDWALLAARLMYERGDASAALDTLTRYASYADRNADYQILYALLLQRAGRNADAANCYRNALLIRPNEGRWWFGLGRALDADHRDADARDAYVKARDSGNLPPELQQAVDRRLR